MFVTIILSCVPGVVSAWRNLIRDTTVGRKIQAVFHSDRKESDKEEDSQPSSEDEFKVRNNDRTLKLETIK